ncbi:MAG: ABC transporter permease [Nitriliruptoraceae bacterium]
MSASAASLGPRTAGTVPDGGDARPPATSPSLLRRVRRSEGVRIVAGLTPALVLIGTLFGTAVVLAVTRSLGTGPSGDEGGATLAAYRRLVADPEFLPSLALTAHVAITSTALAVLLGVGAALVLRRVGRGSRWLTTLFQLNLPVPHVVGAVAILALLGQSGLLSRVATRLGAVEGPAAFPALVFDPYAIGVVAQYVWKEVPFVGIVALAILHAVGDDLDDAARTLGAGPWQRLRHVTLPVLLPGVFAAAIVVFAFAFGAFEVPLLLGRSFPAVLPVLAHRRYTDIDLDARPEAMAISVVITLVVVVAVVLAGWLARRAVWGADHGR